MHWLALHWPPDPACGAQDVTPPLSREALAWWALGFTPHVVWIDEALLLELSRCERLWGGRRALLARIQSSNPAVAGVLSARAAISLVAIGRLRLRLQGGATLPARPADLPLHTLGAARPHLPVLARLGCRTWGQVDALPRAGLARRFGPALGQALDIAFGRASDVHAWITPPDRFEQSLELPERADSAPALLWSARRLLGALQHWLAARQQGVLALELAWTFDQRRIDGQTLPPMQSIELRTAEPVQRMDHLQRLLAERLARAAMLAPARAIRLRALDTTPRQAATPSFLPEDQPRGDPLHAFVERVSARLGTAQVRVPVPQADHRPECRQTWQLAERVLALQHRAPQTRVAEQRRRATPPALSPASSAAQQAAQSVPAVHAPPGWPDALSPTWLLRLPQPLDVQHDAPCHRGQRLKLIAGPHRIESGWWAGTVPGEPCDIAAAPVVARDYFIAQSPSAELLWVYRERPTSAPANDAAARWFLQGLYA